MPRRRLPRPVVVALYGAAGAVFGAEVAVAIPVWGAMMLWLFVLGGGTWPGWAAGALEVAGYGAALTISLGSLALGWRESAPR